jgi:hypothetical protein
LRLSIILLDFLRFVETVGRRHQKLTQAKRWLKALQLSKKKEEMDDFGNAVPYHHIQFACQTLAWNLLVQGQKSLCFWLDGFSGNAALFEPNFSVSSIVKTVAKAIFRSTKAKMEQQQELEQSEKERSLYRSKK